MAKYIKLIGTSEISEVLDGIISRTKNIILEKNEDNDNKTFIDGINQGVEDNDNKTFIDGINLGVDKGVRCAFAYLMKYGYLILDEDTNINNENEN